MTLNLIGLTLARNSPPQPGWKNPVWIVAPSVPYGSSSKKLPSNRSTLTLPHWRHRSEPFLSPIRARWAINPESRSSSFSLCSRVRLSRENEAHRFVRTLMGCRIRSISADNSSLIAKSSIGTKLQQSAHQPSVLVSGISRPPSIYRKSPHTAAVDPWNPHLSQTRSVEGIDILIYQSNRFTKRYYVYCTPESV